MDFLPQLKEHLFLKNSINLEELSKFTKNEILAVYVIRKPTIPILEKALTDNNLTFKN